MMPYFHTPWAWLAAPLLVLAAIAPVAIAIRRWWILERALGRRGQSPVPPITLKLVLVTLAMVLVAAALAGPFGLSIWSEYSGGTVDAIAVFDTSRSMAATAEDGDTGRTALELGQLIADTNLRPALKNNRLAVVSFAREAQDHAFLSRDQRFLHWTITKTVRMGSAPGQGSYLSRGFKRALEMFDFESDSKHHKLIVLFSDGGHEDEDAAALEETITELNQKHVTVQIVGLGPIKPSPIPIAKLSQEDRYRLRDEGEKRGIFQLIKPPEKSLVERFADNMVDDLARRAVSDADWYRNPETKQIEYTARDKQFLKTLATKLGGTFAPVSTLEDFHLITFSADTELLQKRSEQELFHIPLYLAIIFLAAAFATGRRLAKPWGSDDEAKEEKQR